MPVRKVSAREVLGDKPIVASALPFHKALKKDSKPSAKPKGQMSKIDKPDQQPAPQA